MLFRLPLSVFTFHLFTFSFSCASPVRRSQEVAGNFLLWGHCSGLGLAIG